MKTEKNFLLSVAGILLFSAFCSPLLADERTVLEEEPMVGSSYRGMEDYEDISKPKKEWEVKLPAFPEKENLVFFYVSPVQTQRFAIDAKSLITGKDEIRYTLVGLSSGGAKNISYEGVRCANRTYRRYAMGDVAGKWVPSRTNIWRAVDVQNVNQPQTALMRNYFCDGLGIAATKETMLHKLKYQQSLRQDLYDVNY
ncbi:MAG: CNP1-like family protein [Burkholderiaceae bacterium]|jgi:hypothetical protein|nr:CNP1-like family protein [Burkholderiaceae bacterium]